MLKLKYKTLINKYKFADSDLQETLFLFDTYKHNFAKYLLLNSNNEEVFISDRPRAIDLPNCDTKSSSAAPVTSECDEMICSINVVPERGIPTIKIGVVLEATISGATASLICW